MNFRKDIWGSNFAKEFRDNSFCTYINMQYLFKGTVFQFSKKSKILRSHAAAGVTGHDVVREWIWIYNNFQFTCNCQSNSDRANLALKAFIWSRNCNLFDILTSIVIDIFLSLSIFLYFFIYPSIYLTI